MWRYTSIADLANIIKAAFSSTLVIVLILLLTNRFRGFSRSVFVIDLLLTIMLISGFRVGVRFYFEGISEGMAPGAVIKNILGRIVSSSKGQKKLLIIGAGDCGEKMYREIRDNGRLQYRVVGFLDDHPEKVGKKIHGIPVRGSVDQLRPIAGYWGQIFILDNLGLYVSSQKTEKR
jgi:FlaA1/EpsC-like NDP-sugar epimerase